MTRPKQVEVKPGIVYAPGSWITPRHVEQHHNRIRPKYHRAILESIEKCKYCGYLFMRGRECPAHPKTERTQYK